MPCMLCGKSLVYIHSFGPPGLCNECEMALNKGRAELEYKERVIKEAKFQLDVEKEMEKQYAERHPK